MVFILGLKNGELDTPPRHSLVLGGGLYGLALQIGHTYGTTSDLVKKCIAIGSRGGQDPKWLIRCWHMTSPRLIASYEYSMTRKSMKTPPLMTQCACVYF